MTRTPSANWLEQVNRRLPLAGFGLDGAYRVQYRSAHPVCRPLHYQEFGSDTLEAWKGGGCADPSLVVHLVDPDRSAAFPLRTDVSSLYLCHSSHPARRYGILLTDEHTLDLFAGLPPVQGATAVVS